MKFNGKDFLVWLGGLVFGMLILPGIIVIDAVVVPWLKSADPMPYTADNDDAENEARWMLHNARQAVQSSITANGEVPLVLSGEHEKGSCGLPSAELTGQHYVLINGIDILPDGRLQVIAVPLVGNYPLVRLEFYPGDSLGEIVSEPHPIQGF